MTLADETPEATAWLDAEMAKYREAGRFNDVQSAVIWSDIKGEDGKPIIDIDPDAHVSQINKSGQPLLLGHDPGHPLGKVLVARKFSSPTGENFIAAVLGLYAGKRKSFAELNVTTDSVFPSPASVPYFENIRLDLAVDPRQFPDEWLRDIIRNSPFPIHAQRASYNELKSPHQLIRLGVMFVTLAWNPFVTEIGSEAGKDAYGALRSALSYVVERAADLTNPLIEMQSFHDGCQISFMLRQHGVKDGYTAMSKLSGAAIQAQHLIANLRKAGARPVVVAYEYDHEAQLWYPSFAEMSDGEFVTDNAKLIAVEELPRGMSMGLVTSRNRPSE